MTRAPDGAIGADEADRILGLLAHYPVVILAISGGPDSMALMHLTAEWHARTRQPNRIVVATVDHGLRGESAAEAEFVARKAAALGLEHRTKIWQGDKPHSGVPAAARAARYRLLEGLGRELCPHGGAAVVTAHTQDDQAETFLMRLARGSGVEGLAEMAQSRAIDHGEDGCVTLVRPLLHVPKVRLIATLRARAATWVEDPSNARLDLERPRTRALLQRLEQDGLSASAIARSAQRLRRAEEALCYAETRFIEDVGLKADREIYAELDADGFRSAPRLLRERLLSRLIARFGGATPPPQLSEIEDLVENLESSGDVRATLGGAVLSQGARALRVWREVGRAADVALLLQDGLPRLWDNRFWVSAAGVDANAPVSVRCLGAEGVGALPPDARPKAAPSRALWSLPGFYLAERLISVPTLAYHVHDEAACVARPAWHD